MLQAATVLLLTIAIATLAASAEPAEQGAGAAASTPRVQAFQVVVVGTNTPADGPRINAAIAGSPEGAEIVIRGQCLTDETLRLLGNRSYRGDSRTGTVLKQADGANLIALVASSGYLDNNPWTDLPVSIRHLQLDGNRSNNTKTETAGLVLRSWLSVVEDVHIRDMGGDGLRLTNLSANGTGLKTSQVNGRIANCFIERSGRHGVFVEDSQNAVTDWILSDNWIAASGADGIHLDNAAGWYIERNHIYGVPQNAIYAARLFGTSISDNYIEGFGEGDAPGTWHGIYATAQGGAASTISGNRIFSLHGEKRVDSRYQYLTVMANYGTGVAVVTGNAIRGGGTPRETGLYYAAPGERKLMLVSTGNSVESVATKRFVGDHVTRSDGF